MSHSPKPGCAGGPRKVTGIFTVNCEDDETHVGRQTPRHLNPGGKFAAGAMALAMADAGLDVSCE